MPNREAGVAYEQAPQGHIDVSERARILEQILYLQRLEKDKPDDTHRQQLDQFKRAYESEFGPQQWE